MQIGEVAELAGETCGTIRFYESRGLLADPGRAANGYREYLHLIAEPLRHIRTLQRAGLSLNEICALQAIQGSQGQPTPEEQQFISGLQGRLDLHLDTLLRARVKLRSLLEQPPCQPGSG